MGYQAVYGTGIEASGHIDPEVLPHTSKCTLQCLCTDTVCVCTRKYVHAHQEKGIDPEI